MIVDPNHDEHLSIESFNRVTAGWFSLPEDTLPPANFIVDLSHASKLAQTDAGAAQDMLGTLLATLLDASFDNLRHVSAQRPDAPPDEVPTKMGQMHYNLVITTRYLMLVPRQEGDYVLDGEQGQIPLNALCWAGMLMTKEEKHVGLLQMLGIHTLLEHVGFPRAALQSGQEVQ